MSSLIYEVQVINGVRPQGYGPLASKPRGGLRQVEVWRRMMGVTTMGDYDGRSASAGSGSATKT